MASPAGCTYSGGAISRFTATPTAAPTRVSTTRPSAALSAPPTARTSIPLIGTSSRCGPSRSSRPATSETATTSPRLHQVSPVTPANSTASSTPATTLTMRSRPCASVSYIVSCTTSRAVSGASTGEELVCSAPASTNASTAASTVLPVRSPGTRPRRKSPASPARRRGSTLPVWRRSAPGARAARHELLQRGRRVGQPGGVDRLPGAHQVADRAGDVPDVDVHAGEHPAPGEPEGDELPLRQVTADDDAVVAARGDVPGVLHAQVVLVAEEVGQPLVARREAEHGPRGDRGLVERVGPLLDPDVPAQQRVVGVGHVAGGEDRGVRRLQARVDQDAVVDRQAGVGGQPDVRGDPDTGEDDVAGHLGPVLEHERARPGCRTGPRRGDPDAAAQV